jgi:hypothetical protein
VCRGTALHPRAQIRTRMHARGCAAARNAASEVVLTQPTPRGEAGIEGDRTAVPRLRQDTRSRGRSEARGVGCRAALCLLPCSLLRSNAPLVLASGVAKRLMFTNAAPLFCAPVPAGRHRLRLKRRSIYSPAVHDSLRDNSLRWTGSRREGCDLQPQNRRSQSSDHRLTTHGSAHTARIADQRSPSDNATGLYRSTQSSGQLRRCGQRAGDFWRAAPAAHRHVDCDAKRAAWLLRGDVSAHSLPCPSPGSHVNNSFTGVSPRRCLEDRCKILPRCQTLPDRRFCDRCARSPR